MSTPNSRSGHCSEGFFSAASTTAPSEATSPTRNCSPRSAAFSRRSPDDRPARSGRRESRRAGHLRIPARHREPRQHHVIRPVRRQRGPLGGRQVAWPPAPGHPQICRRCPRRNARCRRSTRRLVAVAPASAGALRWLRRSDWSHLCDRRANLEIVHALARAPAVEPDVVKDDVGLSRPLPFGQHSFRCHNVVAGTRCPRPLSSSSGRMAPNGGPGRPSTRRSGTRCSTMK